MAAERYGAPIRVVEVPKISAPEERTVPTAGPNETVAHVNGASVAMGDTAVLCELLARMTEQARLKKLDRATLTAARELSNAVHPHRSW
jgi:hypothetical protein